MCVYVQAVGGRRVTNRDQRTKTDHNLNCIHLSSIFLHRCHLFWKYGNCHDGANTANLDDGDHVCQEVATRYLQSSVQYLKHVLTHKIHIMNTEHDIFTEHNVHKTFSS